MAKQLPYKKKLLNALELKSAGVQQLHSRVTLLVEVFEDADFRADTPGDDTAHASILDRYVDDCALTFLELRAVLQAFPSAADWAKTSLRQLYANAVAKTPREEPVVKQTRRAITVKEHEETLERLRDATCRVNTLTDQLTELREANRELTRENAKLEGRIVELERMLAGVTVQRN